MKISDRAIPIVNITLNTLIMELGAECRNVVALINQLQLTHLTDTQQAEILAELLAATIHLNTHCDQAFQDAIAEEMEQLSDADEAEVDESF
jgi:hypothetical protein